MLSKTETKILALLFDDLTIEHSIREIALTLNLPYPQIHRSISSLKKKQLTKKQKKGKSQIITLNLNEIHHEYVNVEIERIKIITKKYKIIKLLIEDLHKLNYHHFTCILFGSYADKKATKDSDIDLLFIIPEEYDYEKFERFVKHTIITKKTDINITTEKGLIEMWNTPMKLNVGNELLRKHIILFGAEQFLKLRRKYLIG